eukprot:scaffold76368_cov70-Phaeocystis_antarctica.AAC.1
MTHVRSHSYAQGALPAGLPALPAGNSWIAFKQDGDRVVCHHFGPFGITFTANMREMRLL